MTKIQVDLNADDTLVVKPAGEKKPKVTKIEVKDANEDMPTASAEDFLRNTDEAWAEHLQGETPKKEEYDFEITEDGEKNVEAGSTNSEAENDEDVAWEYEARPHKGMKIFSRICFFLLLVAFDALGTALILTQILSVKYLVIFAGGATLLMLILALICFRKRPMPVVRFFVSLFEIVLTIVCLVPTVYLFVTADFVQTAQTKGYQTEKYELLALKSRNFANLNDLTGKKNGVYVDTLTNYDSALAQFNTTVTSESVLENNFLDATKALMNGEVDFILLNSAYKPLVSDFISGFTDKTQSLAEYETKKYPDYDFKNINTATTSFNILVTGADTFGEVSELAKNDLVMIISVNPSTKKILITSVPPNLYLNLDSSVESKDKISNAGIYGIDTTAEALENLLGIKFNYYVRTNFNTLKNLVNAVDGVEVHSEAYAVAVDDSVPYSCTFPQNKKTHLNGVCAVAFARERDSYSDGEVQRLKNQAELSDKLTAKLSSVDSLLYYVQILTATKNNVETNISKDTFFEFIKFNISELPNWQIETQELSGEPKIATLYSLNSYTANSDNVDYFYVLEPTAETLETETEKLKSF